MKKQFVRTILAATILCGLLLLGCVSAPRNKYFQINQGMTQQQVVSILGKPYSRQVTDNGEYWTYVEVDAFDSSSCRIDFVDGKVVRVKTD